MLEKVLRSIAGGGLHSYEELAQKLAVPRPLLEAMIEDLARRGYLSQAGGGDASCGGCSGCGTASCGIAPLWTLTEKGARLARAS